MAALTAAYEVKKFQGTLKSYKMKGATKIYKGALVILLPADGFARPGADTATAIFLGVAYETKDNTTGADGALSILVEKTGDYLYNHSASAAQTSVGKQVLIVDDNTVQTAATTNNIPAGIITEFLTATTVRVRIDKVVF